jgi:hypothetical protein
MFKRTGSLAGLVVGLSLLAAPAAWAQAGGGMAMKAPASREATITGTVVDVSCKFGQGLTGADHRMCAQVCSDRSIPLAILGTDGKLYIPVSAVMPGDAQNARLKEFAEQKVTVQGKVFTAGGAEAIQIASVRGS